MNVIVLRHNACTPKPGAPKTKTTFGLSDGGGPLELLVSFMVIRSVYADTTLINEYMKSPPFERKSMFELLLLIIKPIDCLRFVLVIWILHFIHFGKLTKGQLTNGKSQVKKKLR